MVEKFAIPLTSLGISNILINSFLIYALRKLKKFKTISFKFIILLSISDLCDGITTVAGIIVLHAVSSSYKERMTLIIGYTFKYFFAPFSLIMIFIIAIDRYIHLRYFSGYNTIMTNRRAIIIVVVAVLCVASQCALLMCGRLLGFYPIAQLYLNITVAVCFIMVFVLYTKSYIRIKQETEHMNLETGMPTNYSRRRAASKEVFKSVFFVITAMLICYVPYCIASAISHMGH